jgi:hypothetical protein
MAQKKGNSDFYNTTSQYMEKLEGQFLCEVGAEMDIALGPSAEGPWTFITEELFKAPIGVLLGQSGSTFLQISCVESPSTSTDVPGPSCSSVSQPLPVNAFQVLMSSRTAANAKLLPTKKRSRYNIVCYFVTTQN